MKKIIEIQDSCTGQYLALFEVYFLHTCLDEVELILEG